MKNIGIFKGFYSFPLGRLKDKKNNKIQNYILTKQKEKKKKNPYKLAS